MAESDCLVPILTNRGCGLNGKGFKDNMGVEKVARGCCEKGGTTLGKSDMESIKRNANLTFLFRNYLNRSKQGGGVLFMPKEENKEMGAVMKEGGDLKVQKRDKGAVWKNLNANGKETRGLPRVKRGLDNSVKVHGVEKGAEIKGGIRIEEGEPHKLVESGGEMFGGAVLKSPLELRTIPFQEGEYDPNWISLNSELIHEIKMINRHGELAHGRNRFGWEEVLKMTWKLFLQAWNHFKKRKIKADGDVKVQGDVGNARG